VTNEFIYRLEMTPTRVPAPADSWSQLMNPQMQH